MVLWCLMGYTICVNVDGQGSSHVIRIIPEGYVKCTNLVWVDQGMIQAITIVQSLIARVGISRGSRDSRNVLDGLDALVISVDVGSAERWIQNNEIVT